MTDTNRFWKVRAQKYNNLEWAKNYNYLRAFIVAGKFTKAHKVLDVGTGTGIVAHSVAPLVNQVVGLDISQDMLEHSNWQDNKYFIRGDIRDPLFADGVFDRVTARMVFHHITERTQLAMDECHMVLKPGGMMVLSEGVPPHKDVESVYRRIFELKEDRLTFEPEDLIDLMTLAGFKDIQSKTVWLRQMSVMNWLGNSGLPESKQKKIFKLHTDSSDAFKKHYDLHTLTRDTGEIVDCTIDMRMEILTGVA